MRPWTTRPGSGCPTRVLDSPQHNSEQRELFAALRRAIDEDLTALQRRVFVAIALNEVPMDAFARDVGASRNTVYKSLFDARRKLRASLVRGRLRASLLTVWITMNSEHGVDELLATEAVDVGCAAGFEVLHRYVEEELEGGQPDRDPPWAGGPPAQLPRLP